MTKVAVNEESLTNIANAIRTKTGTQTTYKPSQMAAVINALEPVVDADAVTVTADSTTQHIYPDTDKYFDEVIVNPAVVHPPYVKFMYCTDNTINLTWLRTDNITKMNEFFKGGYDLTSLDLTLFDTSNVTDFYQFFYDCNKLKIENVTGLENFDTSNCTSFHSMFMYMSRNVSTGIGINNLADLRNFDFSKATSTQMMFNTFKCKEIKLNSTNNSRLTDTKQMFYNTNLTTLDLSNFDVSKVNSANQMFSGNANLDNDSLNSIMGAFAENTSLTSGYKTLSYLGFTSSQASVMTELSNWNALQANGWSTGY